MKGLLLLLETISFCSFLWVFVICVLCFLELVNSEESGIKFQSFPILKAKTYNKGDVFVNMSEL